MAEQSVGIIIPPPEIRHLADKTAPAVVEHGPQFEEMAMKEEEHNPLFCFLKKDDPYRPYFDHKVAEIAKQMLEKQNEDLKKQQTEGGIIQQGVTEQNALLSQQLNQKEIQDQKKKLTDEMEAKEKKKIRAPEPDQYTVTQPKGLSQQEVDIIKHCAQFVAKNGKKFLVALTERERQNPQFDFLKPTNDLFPFFLELIESYTRCISIKKAGLEQIITNFKDKTSILNKCGERFEWEKQQKQEQKIKDQQDEEEQQKQAQIDWNDFVVVETIDFVDSDFVEVEDHLGNIQDNDNIVIKQSSALEEKLQKEREQRLAGMTPQEQQQFFMSEKLQQERNELQRRAIEAQEQLDQMNQQEQLNGKRPREEFSSDQLIQDPEKKIHTN